MRQDVVLASGVVGVLFLGAGLLLYTLSPTVDLGEEAVRSSESSSEPAPVAVSTTTTTDEPSEPARTERAITLPVPKGVVGDEVPAIPVLDEPDTTRQKKIAPTLPPGVADAILDEVGEMLEESKVVNLVPGGPQVNLYQDEGYDSLSRAKIDLDQDGQWDEKWDIKAGVVRRRVSPGDDGTYTEAYVWKDGGWKGARKPRSRHQEQEPGR